MRNAQLNAHPNGAVPDGAAPGDDLNPADEQRRRVLVAALSGGALIGGLGWQPHAAAQLFGRLPGRLPANRSIYASKGEVLVNGRRANRRTVITPSDVVETGPDSSVVMVVGADAFAVREQSRMELALDSAAGGARNFFRLVTGKMVGVFGQRSQRRQLRMRTPVATIGIRGTGIYAEATDEQTYLCTCYGTVDMAPVGFPELTKTVTATYHDAPQYIYASPVNGQSIAPAPFINHTDMELAILEALVGREPAFGIPNEAYGQVPRDY